MRELGHGLQEHDAMHCRSCGNEERASEGMPCEVCGTFLCIMCQFKGVTRCAACDGRSIPSSSGTTPKHTENSVDAVNSVDSTIAANMADAPIPTDAPEDEDMLIDRLFDELSLPDDRPTP